MQDEGEKRGGSGAPVRRLFRYMGRELVLGERTVLVGIVNVTPDSFSDGGRFLDAGAAVAHGERLVAAGAGMLDVGGESTRPGAAEVSADAEMRRVIPVIRALRARVTVPLSIDTVKASVAQAALDAGADIINDISGLHRDPGMLEVLRQSQAGCILMHMRGTPATMQQQTEYADLVNEVQCYFAAALERAVAVGIMAERFMLDPGIGFAKTADQNLILIRNLRRLRALDRPLLLGPSRKSFIGRLLPGNPPPPERVWGTAAAVTACILYGADAVRVHDVAEMAQVAAVADALRQRSVGP